MFRGARRRRAQALKISRGCRVPAVGLPGDEPLRLRARRLAVQLAARLVSSSCITHSCFRTRSCEEALVSSLLRKMHSSCSHNVILFCYTLIFRVDICLTPPHSAAMTGQWIVRLHFRYSAQIHSLNQIRLFL